MYIFFLDKILDVIERTPRHIYQILTKREDTMFEYFKDRSIPQNIWLGVSVEDIKSGVPRIDKLRKLNVPVKFFSIEPLLEDIGSIDLSGIDWVIVGGESGSKARAMKKEWVINIQNQCIEQSVAFFFKQWGTWGADGKEEVKKIMVEI